MSRYALMAGCKEACIKAQLEAYYKNCKCEQLKPSTTKDEKNTGVSDSNNDSGSGR